MSPLNILLPDAVDSLLFAFLNECLYIFSTELLIACDVENIVIDRQNWRMSATLWGEKFNLAKHSQGTEVKAITYSAMLIKEEECRSDVFVIVDI